ncbi:MAG: enhanced serine sensitivity protein SseB C-terminal domain-containing protein [Solirubrobacteraceae bacterium]
MPFWRSGRDRGADGGVDRNAPNPRAAPPDTEGSAEQQASLEVEGAMRRVAEQDTPENRTALFELLLGATLLAATSDSNSEGGERGLAMIAGEDGPALPVFTRIEAMLAWRPTGYGPVALTGRTLFETAARYNTAKIEVNPASVPRGWISRAEIESLAQGCVPLGPSEHPAPSNEPAAPNEPASPTELKLGRPTVRPPEALIEAARRALVAQPHTLAGWICETVRADGPPQLMVGVELARGLDQTSVEETMQAIVEETWARSADAHRLKFMLVTGDAFRNRLAAGDGELIFER